MSLRYICGGDKTWEKEQTPCQPVLLLLPLALASSPLPFSSC